MNVTRLLGEFIDEDASTLCSVLEFCSKGELYDFVVAKKCFSDAEAKSYFKQIVSALAFVHERGVAHLDCSLENILIHESGELKLCDFGLARMTQASRFPFTGRFGKSIYMPPEIFAGESFDGYECDAWALGIILFLMLTGVPPFERPSRMDARFKLVFNGNLKVLLQAWSLEKIVSDDAANMISSLLCIGKNRLSLKAIFAHPWLQDAS